MPTRNSLIYVAVGVALMFIALGAMSLAGCGKDGAPAGGGGAATPTAGMGGEQPAVQFANVRCPIMGTPVDPAKVPASLTRDYKGQKVAFCCGGCPVAWDKLTDAERESKLATVVK